MDFQFDSVQYRLAWRYSALFHRSVGVAVLQLTGQIKSQVAEKIEVVKQHSGEDGSLLGHVRREN